MKKIVAICACPMGVAHTYMAADAIEEAGKKLGCEVKVETQGASGIENKLSDRDIAESDLIMIASLVKIAKSDRLEGYEDKTRKSDLKYTINHAEEIISSFFNGEE